VHDGSDGKYTCQEASLGFPLACHPCREVRSVKPLAQSGCTVHAVEGALAFALSEAAKAGEWAIVAQIAKELEARRLAGSPTLCR
jgi:hypothetical protein